MIWSPDSSALFGPVPELRNYFCCNGIIPGFSQSGGLGLLSAEWIVDGEPKLDMFGWDLARYGAWAGAAFTKARVRDQYANRFKIHFPNEERSAGRPVRTRPIYAAQKALGGVFGNTRGLLDEFGADRVRDTPISESAFSGAATGAAAEGLRPLAELMFVDFFGVCMDQIYNHLAKNTYMAGGHIKLPVVLTTAIGGGYNDAAQHSQCLYATFAHMPGLKVVVPSNAYDAKGLMIQAIRDDNPVLFMYHKGIMGLPWMAYFEGSSNEVPEAAYTIPFGQASVAREGSDVTIVTLSQMVQKALLAAEELVAERISVEVIDLRTLVPLDREAVLRSVRKTGRLLVADEDYLGFGLTGEIAAIVAENLDTVQLKAPVKRVVMVETWR